MVYSIFYLIWQKKNKKIQANSGKESLTINKAKINTKQKKQITTFMNATKLFFIGTLLLSVSLWLRAEEPPSIILTTNRLVGDTITLAIDYPESAIITIEGIEPYEGVLVSKEPKTYKLKSSTVTLKGYIENLFCMNNALTNISIEKSPQLLGLFCHANQLTALDISKNPNLTSLVCENNKIKTLDVSKNVNLEWLDCGNNELTGLDITNNEALIVLYIGGNKFTSMIDISRNKNLIDFNCFGLDLETLDISHLENLIQLSCFNNKLKKLDLSKQAQLKGLNCFNNQLTELDLTNNTKLSTILCFTNKIEGKGMLQLVSSIPSVDLQTNYSTGVLGIVNSLNNGYDNRCTTDDVQALKAKNWDVIDMNINPDSVLTGKGNPKPYEGITSIQNIGKEEQSISIVPNPVQNIAKVSGVEGEVLLFNAEGGLIQQLIAIPNTTLLIDLQQEPEGLYFLVNRGKISKLLVKR